MMHPQMAANMGMMANAAPEGEAEAYTSTQEQDEAAAALIHMDLDRKVGLGAQTALDSHSVLLNCNRQSPLQAQLSSETVVRAIPTSVALLLCSAAESKSVLSPRHKPMKRICSLLNPSQLIAARACLAGLCTLHFLNLVASLPFSCIHLRRPRTF